MTCFGVRNFICLAACPKRSIISNSSGSINDSRTVFHCHQCVRIGMVCDVLAGAPNLKQPTRFAVIYNTWKKGWLA